MHRLDVLGPPRLTRPDGSPAELALGKPFAVLVFLALTDTPPTRKELARLFWPASEPRNARQSVRQTLSILRRALGPDLFQADDPVKLDPRSLETDVDRLREALEEGDVETAETLWRGPFMQEFALPDAPEWTRWVETREMALEAALVQLLAAEADVLRGRGEPDRAVGRLEKAIGIDPYREALHSALVDLHLEGGRLTKAASAIGRARELLGPDTPAVAQMAQRLERRVRRADGSENGTATATSAAAAAAAAPAEIRTELVGRTREMAVLLDAWRKSAAGSSHVVVLTGAAGIGKTRLTEELAEAAGAQGATEVRVVAERNERALEWGLIAELARKLARLPGAGDVEPSAAATLRRLSPAIPMGQQPVAGELEPTPVAGSVSALLLRVTGEQPLLIVIDEAQWVDEPSRAVLSRIARSLDGARTALVVCLQDEEAGDAGRDFIAALEHAEHPVRLRLSALSDGDVREMIALMVDLPEENAVTFRDRLARAADGNPLYLTELLRALVDEGTLVAGPEGLRLSGERLPDPLPLPSGVRELLRRRLAALSDPAIAFAAHLARLGGQAGLQEVKERADLSEGQVARAAGELLSAQIVVWQDPERIAFAHERLRRAVLDAYPVRRNTENDRGWFGGPQRRLAIAVALAATVLATAVLATTLAHRRSVIPPAAARQPVTLWVQARNEGRILTLADPAASEPSPAGTFDYHGLVSLDLAKVARRVRTPDGRRSEIVDAVSLERLVLVPGPEPADVAELAWAPDGSRLLYEVGKWYEDRGFVRRPYVLDLHTGAFGPLGDLSSAHPLMADWAPGGTRIALALRTGDTYELFLLNADGTEAIPVGSTSHDETDPRWSPDGRRIAFVSGEGNARDLMIMNADGTGRRTVVSSAWAEFSPAWLDDHRLAFVMDQDGQEDLWMVDADRPDSPVRMTEEGGFERIVGVTGTDRAEPVTSVRISVSDTTVSPGQIVPLAVEVVAPRRPADARIRWKLIEEDRAHLSLDSGPALRVTGEGPIRLVADMAGWRADTIAFCSVPVTSRDAPVLLEEDWRGGIPEDRWQAFGTPRPFVRAGIGPNAGAALINNGDQSYNSGVVSVDPFPTGRGLTVEAWGRLPLTAELYQSVRIALAESPDIDPGDGERYEDVYTALIKFGRVAGGGALVSDLDELITGLPPRPDMWRRHALQIRADGRLDWIIDGRIWASRRVEGELPDSAYVVLFGRSVQTEAAHGPVVVWGGVRYEVEAGACE